jgi:hypothetical protein
MKNLRSSEVFHGRGANGESIFDVALARALDGASALGNVSSLEVAAHSVLPALAQPFEATCSNGWTKACSRACLRWRFAPPGGVR